QINIPFIRSGHRYIHLAVARQIGADNAAQFMRTGVEITRSAEFTLGLAKIDGDSPIQIGDREIWPAIAIEIPHGDPFRAIVLIEVAYGGVPNREPIPKGFEIVKELPRGLLRERNSRQERNGEAVFQEGHGPSAWIEACYFHLI